MKPRLFALALACHFAASAFAAGGDLMVLEAWIRTAPPNAPLAGYMTLENRSGKERQLVAATSPDFGRVTVHRTEHAAGMTAMKQLAALSIPAHGRLVLQPGADHLMLEEPKQALQAGRRVPVALRFADGSAMTVRFEVRDASAGAHDHHRAAGVHEAPP